MTLSWKVIAAVVGVATIVVLNAIRWWVARRRSPRSRSVDHDHELQETLRKIAATDYARRTRPEKDGRP